MPAEVNTVRTTRRVATLPAGFDLGGCFFPLLPHNFTKSWRVSPALMLRKQVAARNFTTSFGGLLVYILKVEDRSWTGGRRVGSIGHGATHSMGEQDLAPDAHRARWSHFDTIQPAVADVEVYQLISASFARRCRQIDRFRVLRRSHIAII